MVEIECYICGEKTKLYDVEGKHFNYIITSDKTYAIDNSCILKMIAGYIQNERQILLKEEELNMKEIQIKALPPEISDVDKNKYKSDLEKEKTQLEEIKKGMKAVKDMYKSLKLNDKYELIIPKKE